MASVITSSQEPVALARSASYEQGYWGPPQPGDCVTPNAYPQVPSAPPTTYVGGQSVLIEPVGNSSGTSYVDPSTPPPYYHPHSNSFVITTSAYDPYGPGPGAGTASATSDVYYQTQAVPSENASSAVAAAGPQLSSLNQITETSYLLAGIDPLDVGYNSTVGYHQQHIPQSHHRQSDEDQDTGPATYLDLAMPTTTTTATSNGNCDKFR